LIRCKGMASLGRQFMSPNGFQVVAGRNAKENDVLTFAIAHPLDMWFHIEELSGPHVVMKHEKVRQFEREDICFASDISKQYCSKANKNKKYTVHYCNVIDVERTRVPGRVILKSFTRINI
jgi:predicted ribosome quality control (RQC) complex YloA/Tae2 family protein